MFNPTFVHALAALVTVAYARPYGPGDGWDDNGDGDDSYGSNRGGGSGFFDSFLGFDVERAMYIRTVHGIMAAIAFVGLFPIGSILLRTVPGRAAWIVHAICQVLAYCLYIAAAGLGLWMVANVRMPNGDGASLLNTAPWKSHPIIGLVILALFFFQPILGWVHHIRFKRLGRRTLWSHAHLFLGRTLITLGIVNGGIGLKISGVSTSTIVVYSVIATIVWLFWIGLAIWHEVKRIRESRRGSVVEINHNRKVTYHPDHPYYRNGSQNRVSSYQTPPGSAGARSRWSEDTRHENESHALRNISAFNSRRNSRRNSNRNSNANSAHYPTAITTNAATTISAPSPTSVSAPSALVSPVSPIKGQAGDQTPGSAGAAAQVSRPSSIASSSWSQQHYRQHHPSFSSTGSRRQQQRQAAAGAAAAGTGTPGTPHSSSSANNPHANPNRSSNNKPPVSFFQRLRGSSSQKRKSQDSTDRYQLPPLDTDRATRMSWTHGVAS